MTKSLRSRVLRPWKVPQRGLPTRGARGAALLALLAGLCVAQPRPGAVAMAQSPQQLLSVLGNTGPSGTVERRRSDGYQLIVDTRWIDSHGYRPIRIEVAPDKTPGSDETLTIRFITQEGETWRPDTHTSTVEKSIVVPAGTLAGTPVQTTLSAPVLNGWQRVEVEVFRNGRELEGLGMTFSVNVQVGTALNYSGASPQMNRLNIDSAAQPRGSGPQTVTNSLRLHPSELPEDWIDLTALDLIVVSLDDLALMASQEPQRLQALRDWTFAGGHLWVAGLDEDFGQLGEVQEHLGISSGAVLDEPWSTAANLPRERTSRSGQISGGMGSAGISPGFMGTEPAADPSQEVQARAIVGDSALGRWRPYGVGRLVALAAEMQDAMSQNSGSGFGITTKWDEATADYYESIPTWEDRHGVSPAFSNPVFYDFLIPGVGLPPVVTFEVLITLFVIIIGPVNYLVLRRRRRLHLLVVTVPAMALVVTLGLFAYAVLSDGLSVRVMPRTFTLIDQRTSQATCWSRLSYYAGLTPSGGLAFSEDVAVYPMPAETPYRYNTISRRTMVWDDQQRLTSGWLQARTPTQLITVRSRTSNYKLDISEPTGQSPNVQNLLGTRVHYLVLCDSTGAVAVGENMAANERQVLTAAANAQATLEDALKVIRDSAPRPIYGAPDSRDLMFFDPYYDLSPDGVGVLERQMNEKRDMLQFAKAGGSGLPWRSYIAIVEKSPESQFGTDIEQEHGFHIIFGRW